MKDLRKYNSIFIPISVLSKESIIDQDLMHIGLSVISFPIVLWIIISILSLVLVFIFLRSAKQQQALKYQLGVKDQEFKMISENMQNQLGQANTESKEFKNLLEFKEGVTQMLLHDLKNPLSLMVNYELFSKELLGHAANQMLNIVTNIVDVQNYEKTKMNLYLKEVQLLGILKKAYSQVEFLFTQKNLNYYNTIQGDLRVYADEQILERVIVNLLLNAVKYAPLGSDISIMAEKVQDKFKISIIDTGSEIPEDIHNLVFDQFGLLVANKSNAARSGILGLSFCKLAIEAHDEAIGISSNEQKTNFWFTLRGTGTIHDFEEKSLSHFNITEVHLSDESKDLLKDYISELKSVKVYEFSAIRNIIKQIEKLEKEDLKTWVINLTHAVQSGDEELYNDLIKLAQ